MAQSPGDVAQPRPAAPQAAPAPDGRSRARRWAVRAAAVATLAAGAVLASATVGVTPWPDRATHWPGERSTGVPAGTALQVHEGDLVVSEPGTVVDGLDVRGVVVVLADDVTITNTRVRGRPATHTTALIGMSHGYRNLTVRRSELVPDEPSPYLYGVIGWDLTLDEVEIARVVDGVHVIGSDVTVRSSWIHSLVHYDADPNEQGGPTHDDGVQVQAGSNVRILDNRIEGGWNAAVQVTQDRGPTSDLVITGNFLDDGLCTVNIVEKSFGPLAGVTVSGNTFGRGQRATDCAIVRTETTVLTAEGNHFVDGVAVRLRRA